MTTEQYVQTFYFLSFAACPVIAHYLLVLAGRRSKLRELVTATLSTAVLFMCMLFVVRNLPATILIGLLLVAFCSATLYVYRIIHMEDPDKRSEILWRLPDDVRVQIQEEIWRRDTTKPM